MSILSLHGVSLTLAGNCILDKVDWQIQPQDRIALVGRNGAGKSTLLKLLQGVLTPDSGQIQQLNGLRVAGLNQDIPITQDETVYHFLTKGLGEVGEVLAQYREASNGGSLDKLAKLQQKIDDLNAWDFLPRIETMATKLDLQPDSRMNQLSGGLKRRVLLAAALITSPELLLLDEPTNHLDITAIEWLESYLKTYKGSVIVITHDREFLSQIANSIVEINRGHLHFFDCNYEAYMERRESLMQAEQKQFDLFDKRLSEEEVWIRKGIQARRTRNEGRVRALKAMREQYKQRRNQLGKAKAISLDVSRSGHVVIEAQDLNHSYDEKNIIRDFSFLLSRGDKVGIIGSNGCGKTTLIRLLLGELAPDSGTVRLGTSLAVAYFDQLRSQLNDDQTLMANVGDGADFVTINGQQKHVASYLREFLFPPERFNQLVSCLSGGERNRLLLAKLLAKPVNLLVMDEPTNDLDIETMELLESMLLEYPGTLLLISHDRAFINQVVTSVLVHEGDGLFNDYVGGYDDYRQQKKQQKDVPAVPTVARIKPAAKKLSFNEQRELSMLPKQIEEVEKRIASLHTKIATPAFYQQSNAEIMIVQKKLAEEEAILANLYSRWELLEDG